MKKVAIAGTGMMGPRIATALAQAGVEVILVSRKMQTAEDGVRTAREQLDWLAENGLLDSDEASKAGGRISPSDDPISAVGLSEMFIESIPEDLEIKKEYFARLDAASDTAILCSNTSGISITEIASKCKRPSRVLTAHFWNPAHLMPLVDVVMGRETDEGIAKSVVDFLRACGKTAVLVRKDRPGQLGNRIQHAMIRECMNIVAEGIASPEDVDLAVMAGFGLRTPVYGVFEHADMVGLDLVKAVQDYVTPDLSTHAGASPVHNEKVEKGNLGVKTGQGFLSWPAGRAEQVQKRRDEFLLEFLKMKKARRFD